MAPLLVAGRGYRPGRVKSWLHVFQLTKVLKSATGFSCRAWQCLRHTLYKATLRTPSDERERERAVVVVVVVVGDGGGTSAVAVAVVVAAAAAAVVVLLLLLLTLLLLL